MKTPRKIIYSLISEDNGIVLTIMNAQKSGNPVEEVLEQVQGLLKQEHFDQACAVLRAAIKDHPEEAALYQRLGVALARAGQKHEAIDAFKKAIGLDPGNIRACFGLGTALMEEGFFSQAENYCRRGLEIDEDCMPFYPVLFNALFKSGQTGEAEMLLRKAMKKAPDDPVLQENFAYLMIELGRREEAVKMLEKLIEQVPLNANHYQLLVDCRSFETESDPYIRQIETLLDHPDIDERGKSTLHFTLATIYRGLGDPEKSFRHYKTANEYARSVMPYDHSVTVTIFEQIKKTFTPDFLNSYKNAGPEGEQLIFIIGMPRSGTSLTEQILASHSNVFGAGELKTISYIQKDVLNLGKSGSYERDLKALKPEDIRSGAKLYLDRIQEFATAAPRIVDKMPQNFMFTGLIHLMFPKAKIIHCLRDKRDVLFSNFKSDFKDDLPFTFSLDDLSDYYDSYKDLMAHWHRVLPGQIFDFQYEDLIKNQEAQTRALLEHCELEFEESCLSFHETKRRVGTASMTQVQRPLYKSGVAGWKKYADFLPEKYFQD